MEEVIIAVIGTLIFVWLFSLELRVRKLQPFLSFVDLAAWFVQNFRPGNRVDNNDEEE
jgi:hypothetical protein